MKFNNKPKLILDGKFPMQNHDCEYASELDCCGFTLYSSSLFFIQSTNITICDYHAVDFLSAFPRSLLFCFCLVGQMRLADLLEEKVL